MSKDIIYRQDVIDALNAGAELLRRVLDNADIVGTEREKYEWGLGLIESYIVDMKDLPPVQPDRGYAEQIKWERDIAIQQLKGLGYSLVESRDIDADRLETHEQLERIRQC